MSVTEVLGGLGSWELELDEQTPDEVMAQLGFFGHLVIVDGPVDVAAAGNSLLADARYVGVCRGVGKPGTFERDGEGLLFWLADEDGKGHYLETAVTLTNATLAAAVTALLPPTVTVGTVFAQPDPLQRYTGPHQFQSRREALGIVVDTFGVELRVNGDFSVDVGTAAQLYDTALPVAGKPSPIIVRHGAGSDIDVTAVGGNVQTEGSARDYTTRTLLLGQTVGTGDEPDEVFVTAAVETVSTYKDPQGAAVKLTRVISESGETEGSATVRAQLHHNRFNRTTTAVKVTADEYDVEGAFRVGDACYVYDPDSGIVDAANQVHFHGEVLHPRIVRVSADTWPIIEGYTVAWRTDAGVWLDLTRWVVWEAGQTNELTVGDLSKTLIRGGSNPVQDRVDAARPSTKIPKAPTGLVLATSSAINPKGTDSAVITASWNPVTQNTDNTTVALSHYEVQLRPTFRAPLWLASPVTADVSVDLAVTAALSYDVHVRAVSTSGKVSDWTATAPIVSAADSTAPGTPSDPVVTSYLGQLRIVWDGLNNVGGAMPADFNRVDVHVGTTAGFTSSAATLVSSSSTGGVVAYATAPYGSTRYVRLIAYDHNGNPSPSSAVASGATVQVADGDIAALNVGKLVSGIVTADITVAGRFATALTGARREMNSIGFQAWDASNNLTISLDGVNNLLTGQFRTALTGRRIEMGTAGTTGELRFLAPDGTLSTIRAFTASTGVEAIQMAVPIAGTHAVWNSVQVESEEQIHFLSGYHEHMFGGDGPGLKSWRVSQATSRGTASVYPVRTARLLIAETFSSMRAQNGFTELRVNDTEIELTPGTLSANGSIMVQQQDFIDANFRSPYLKWRTDNNNVSGAGVFEAILKFTVLSNSTDPNFAFRNSNDSAYVECRAETFTNSSTRAGKTDIADLDIGALAKVRGTKAKKYRRKVGVVRSIVDEDGRTVGHEEVSPAPEAIGLIAEEAPREIVTADGEAVDLYKMTTLLWKAVQEIADEQDRRVNP